MTKGSTNKNKIENNIYKNQTQKEYVFQKANNYGVKQQQ